MPLMMGEKQREIIGFIPFIALVLLIGLVFFTGSSETFYNEPLLVFVFQFIFVFAVSILVTIVSARAYLLSGSHNILLMGLASLMSGVLLIIAQWGVTPSLGSTLTTNEATTIGNVGILLASILILLSAILLWTGKIRFEPALSRAFILGISLFGALVLIVAVFIMASSGLFPVFFISGVGSTTLRWEVLTISGTFLTISCLLFGWKYLKTRSSILYWYSLGIALFTISLIGIVFTVRIGDAINWCGRIGLYLTGSYFLLAVISRGNRLEKETGLSERWAEAFSSPQQIAALFANMTNGFVYGKIVTDNEGRPIDVIYLYMNRAYEKYMGGKRERVLGRRATEAFPELKNAPPDWFVPYGNAALKGESTNFERLWPVTNRWYNIIIYSPQKGYFAAIMEDINERKRAEEALKQSEERANDLIKYAPTGIYELDYRIPKFTKVNEAMCQILGYSEEELLAIDPSEIMDEETRKLFSERIKKILSGEKVEEHAEFVIIAKDGRKIFANLNVKMIYEDGKPVRAFVIANDITARKEMEEALKEGEERFRTLADNVSQLEWIADPTGFIVWYNKKWYDYTGTTPEQMEGWGWQSVHDPEVLPKVLEQWKSSIATGQPFDMVFPLLGADGVFRPFLTRVLPVKDEHGKVIRWFGTNTDLTEELEMRKSLERSNAELQQFAYVASHDLQEPLRMVINYLSLLERKNKDKLDPKSLEYVNFAVEGGERMRQLVDNLLEYSRIETRGKGFALVDMQAVITKTLTLLKVPIEESGAVISVEPLPCIMADESQMIQVMQNLIGNSLKFHGLEPPKINISASKGADAWTFGVEDNGIGLNMIYAEKIFQMFQRLHSRAEYPGTGVGLAIAKKIIDRHGGRIWVESEEGKGATFFFTIPILSS